MKKFIYLLVFLFTACSSSGKWEIIHCKGDELKSFDECFLNVFTAKNGDKVQFNSNGDAILLTSNNNIFDIDTTINCSFGIPKDYIEVIIGFYVNGNLTDKKTASFSCFKGIAKNAILCDFLDNESICKQIINHIRYKGDVRIIASKFHDSDFDVRMTKNPNIRVSSN